MRRPEGFVTVKSITDSRGRPISAQKAIHDGIVTPGRKIPDWLTLDRGEIPLGKNLFLDSGRQLLAFAFGFASPISNFVCKKFAVGTGTTAPNVGDTALEAPINLTDTNSDTVLDSPFKAIGAVTWPAPFIVHVEMPLGLSDANGYLISELGLFSEDETIFSRLIMLGKINKDSSQSMVLTWRIRF